MQGSHTAWVGNLVAMVSALITVLVLGAGFITYFSAKARAEKEARDAARQWFDENAQKLNDQIGQLQLKAEAALQAIASHQNNVDDAAKAATQTINDRSQQVTAAADELLQVHAKSGVKPGVSSLNADKKSSNLVQQANESLKTKAETEFTANEHYIHGVSLYTTGNFQSALDSFEAAIFKAASATLEDQVKYVLAKAVTLSALGKSEEAIAVYDEIDRRFGKDDSPAVREQVIKGLVNKGVRLGALGKSEEEIAVYEEIDRRFGKDESPGEREQVARGLNGAAFARILSAKQNWHDSDRSLKLLTKASDGLQRALSLCSTQDRSMLLGNLGYSFFLLGQRGSAVDSTQECLKLGGQQALQAQQADAQRHRVEPEDTEYENLLAQLWKDLQPPTA